MQVWEQRTHVCGIVARQNDQRAFGSCSVHALLKDAAYMSTQGMRLVGQLDIFVTAP